MAGVSDVVELYCCSKATPCFRALRGLFIWAWDLWVAQHDTFRFERAPRVLASRLWYAPPWRSPWQNFSHIRYQHKNVTIPLSSVRVDGTLSVGLFDKTTKSWDLCFISVSLVWETILRLLDTFKKYSELH